MKNSAVIWTALIAVVAVIASLIVSSGLPAVVPVHWNAAGKPDGFGPKSVMLWLMPAVMVGIVGLTWLLPVISPKKFEIERFAKTYTVMMVAIQLMELCIHLLMLRGAGNVGFNLTRALFPVMFVFFAVMGNWMGKVRQNYFMGVRTPWTLADERVWDQTHREAGHLWFWGGLVGALVSGLGVSTFVSVGFLLAIAFMPIIRSYLIAKKLGVVGQPAP